MSELKKFSSNYFGFTFEELLISTLISSIIILILFTLYTVVYKQSNRIEQEINILHNHMVVDFFLRNKIRQSGYKGFASKLQIPEYNSISSFNRYFTTPEAPIAVCNPVANNCQQFVTSNIFQKIILNSINPSSDILIIYDIPDYVAYLSEDMLFSSDPIKIATPKNFNDTPLNLGDHLIIADLQYINRFILSNISNGLLFHEVPMNKTSCLVKKFLKGSEMFRVKHIAFYVAKNPNQQSDYSLYMEDLNGYNHAQAIVDGIDNLSVQVFNLDKKAKQEKKLISASKLGWIYQKYILINLVFSKSKKHMNHNFAIGVEINNI
jgi:Tfp pilus assembly protein PilE